MWQQCNGERATSHIFIVFNNKYRDNLLEIAIFHEYNLPAWHKVYINSIMKKTISFHQPNGGKLNDFNTDSRNSASKILNATGI